MNFELTASIMCANYGNLEKEMRNLEEAGWTPSISISWTAGMCQILPTWNGFGNGSETACRMEEEMVSDRY